MNSDGITNLKFDFIKDKDFEIYKHGLEANPGLSALLMRFKLTRLKALLANIEFYNACIQ